MRGRPDERRLRIHANPVRCSLDVIVDNGVAGLPQLLSLATSQLLNFTHAPDEPELCVRRVAIPRGLAVDDVRQGSVFLERREGLQNLECVFRHARGDHATHEDERVAPPVQEPRITRDHGLQVVATDDVEIKRLPQDGREGPHRRHGRDLGRRRRDRLLVEGPDQEHRVSDLEIRTNPSRTEKVTAPVLSAFGLLRMSDAVRPLGLVMIRTADHGHPKSPIIR